MMLTSGELAGLREALKTTLTSSAVVLRRSVTKGKAGGEIHTHVTSAEYPCRVIPIAAPKDAEIASGIADKVNAQVVLPWDADIQNTDRLEVDGLAYEIIGIPPTTERISTQAYCVRIDQA